MKTTSTFCRICEPACGLIAHVGSDGSIQELRADLDHPSGGRPCHKGLSFLDVHRSPDRLNWPLKRLNARSESTGLFERTSWDDALGSIGDRIRELREAYGPNSIAIYYGNPFGVGNSAGWAAVEPLRQAIGTQMIFSAGTQDVTNKTAAAAAVYGASGVLTIPDLANTDYFVCIGANPLVSRWTAMSHPNDDLASLEAIPKRGGKVLFVNPRKIESSTPSTGPTLLIKPGTDVYFLAALFNALHARGAFSADVISSRSRNFNALAERVSRYTSAAVEHVTGIAASPVEEIATDLASARSAAIYVSTGVNQSRQGTLAFLLAEMINFATGNLGRKGGTIKPNGLIDYFAPASGTATVETSAGQFELPDPIGAATLPAAATARLVGGGDIRALIVCGGNPILTVGGGEEMRAAYAKLDLLVSIDIFRSATGELADFVLPSADWLEHSDVNLLSSGLQPRPYAQYTPAIVAPAHERRNGWWILHSLTSRLGADTPLDAMPEDVDGESMFGAILAGNSLSIDQLAAAPHGVALIEEKPPESFFARCVVHPDGLINCCPDSFVSKGLFDRMASIFEELCTEDAASLKLISLRTRYMHNSWLGNTRKIRAADRTGGALHMTSHDAAARGLLDGDPVKVSNDRGAIETRLCIDDDLRAGVVAMTHGFGQAQAPAMRVASLNDAGNCNALMSTDAEDIEPISYMSWMTAVPVQVTALG